MRGCLLSTDPFEFFSFVLMKLCLEILWFVFHRTRRIRTVYALIRSGSCVTSDLWRERSLFVCVCLSV